MPLKYIVANNPIQSVKSIVSAGAAVTVVLHVPSRFTFHILHPDDHPAYVPVNDKDV